MVLWSYLVVKLTSVCQCQVGLMPDRRMLELHIFASISGQLVPMEDADHLAQAMSSCLNSV